MNTYKVRPLQKLPMAVALTSMTLLPQFAASQTLEEVVVTAQKRSQSLQDVPISVSALGGNKLNDANLTRTADLMAYVPT